MYPIWDLVLEQGVLQAVLNGAQLMALIVGFGAGDNSVISGLAMAGLMTSCQAPARLHTPNSTVTCSKCGTVYFKAPALAASSPGGKGFVTLHDASHMDCPECENEVVAWLKTGSLTRHICKTCGGALNHCTKH